MKRVLINLAGWIALPFLFLWLLCCSGCVVWRTMEGETYASSLITDDEYDPLWQVQLSGTHYK